MAISGTISDSRLRPLLLENQTIPDPEKINVYYAL